MKPQELREACSRLIEHVRALPDGEYETQAPAIAQATYIKRLPDNDRATVETHLAAIERLKVVLQAIAAVQADDWETSDLRKLYSKVVAALFRSSE